MTVEAQFLTVTRRLKEDGSLPAGDGQAIGDRSGGDCVQEGDGIVAIGCLVEGELIGDGLSLSYLDRIFVMNRRAVCEKLGLRGCIYL